MAKVKITQVKSSIERPQVQKDTLVALGLRRNQTSVVHEATPVIQGMINRVLHLVKVEEI